MEVSPSWLILGQNQLPLVPQCHLLEGWDLEGPWMDGHSHWFYRYEGCGRRQGVSLATLGANAEARPEARAASPVPRLSPRLTEEGVGRTADTSRLMTVSLTSLDPVPKGWSWEVRRQQSSQIIPLPALQRLAQS